MKDWRRINVSFTRAKAKLVIFGSRKTLQGDKLLKEFVELMERKKWLYQLPAGLEKLHEARDISARSSPTKPGKGKSGAQGNAKRVQASLTGWVTSKPLMKDLLAVCPGRSPIRFSAD